VYKTSALVDNLKPSLVSGMQLKDTSPFRREDMRGALERNIP